MDLPMSDLEITRLCAAAMGIPVFEDAEIGGHIYSSLDGDTYNPLHDDMQAMALVKKMQLFIMPEHEGLAWLVSDKNDHEQFQAGDDDLNHAICEVCAKLQQAKIKAAFEAAQAVDIKARL